MNFSTGQIINNRYRIVKMIAKGGFGAVYRAWDLNLNSPCAVKQNFDTTPEASQQFSREASLLANLRYPNLPKVIDHFIVPGQGQFLVMEYIAGHDVQELIDQAGGSLSEAQVLPWIMQILDALIYLHNQDPPVVHRDIKPANVRITPEGQAMLVDFGIAKIFDPHHRTSIGARATTPGYAPIEQYGQAPTDVRSDVYALGATMYAALTGQAPPESIARASGTSLTPPRMLNPAITPQTEAVILRCMEMASANRYQTITELKSDLTADAPESAYLVSVAKHTAPNIAAVPEVQRRSGGLPWGWLAGGLVLLLILCGIGGWLGYSNLDVSNLGVSSGQEEVDSTQQVLKQTVEAMEVVRGIQATLDVKRETEQLATHQAQPATDTAQADLAVVPTATSSENPISLPVELTSSAVPGIAPTQISITEWGMIFFVELSSGCKLKDAQCIKLADDWKATQGGADAFLTSKISVYIHPDWPNPYLVFWHKRDLKRTAQLTIQADGKWQAVRDFTSSSSDWKQDAVNLANFKGKEIFVQYTAEVGWYRQSQWFLQEIQVIPDYKP